MADNLFYHYPQNSIAAFYALGTSPKIKSKNQGCVQSQNGVDLLEASIFFLSWRGQRSNCSVDKDKNSSIFVYTA